MADGGWIIGALVDLDACEHELAAAVEAATPRQL
jgi:hypothetical protein